MRRADLGREQVADARVTSIDEARDRRRLTDLTREHREFLLGLARKLCRSTFDADDLVQDVLLKTVAHYDRIPPDANHAAWMARVMREARYDDVWAYLSLAQVAGRIDDLRPLLGRRTAFWSFLVATWRRYGVLPPR